MTSTALKMIEATSGFLISKTESNQFLIRVKCLCHYGMSSVKFSSERFTNLPFLLKKKKT